MFLWELLSGLGLGGQVVTAAVLLLSALYIIRAVRLGRLVAGLAGSVAMYSLAILVVAALAIGLGWVDPHVSRVLEHVTTGAAWVWETATGPARDVVGRVLG